MEKRISPVMGGDQYRFYPTILEMLSLPFDPKKIDGKTPDSIKVRKWIVARFTTVPRTVIMECKVLVVRLDGFSLLEYFENGTVQLFNLSKILESTRIWLRSSLRKPRNSPKSFIIKTSGCPDDETKSELRSIHGLVVVESNINPSENKFFLWPLFMILNGFAKDTDWPSQEIYSGRMLIPQPHMITAGMVSRRSCSPQRESSSCILAPNMTSLSSLPKPYPNMRK